MDLSTIAWYNFLLKLPFKIPKLKSKQNKIGLVDETVIYHWPEFFIPLEASFVYVIETKFQSVPSKCIW